MILHSFLSLHSLLGFYWRVHRKRVDEEETKNSYFIVTIIVCTAHSTSTEHRQEKDRDTQKICIECEKMAFHRMTIVTWNVLCLENITSRILKNENKDSTRCHRRQHTHKLCKRNKAMEFFNLYSQSRIQSELKFCSCFFFLPLFLMQDVFVWEYFFFGT